MCGLHNVAHFSFLVGGATFHYKKGENQSVHSGTEPKARGHLWMMPGHSHSLRTSALLVVAPTDAPQITKQLWEPFQDINKEAPKIDTLYMSVFSACSLKVPLSTVLLAYY